MQEISFSSTLQDRLIYLDRIDKAWKALNSEKNHNEGSFAKFYEEIIKSDRLHPSALILQYAQSYLLVAVENLKYWCEVENLYLGNPELGKLPILSPYSNIRASIESSATILWTLENLKETHNFERVVQLSFSELSTFRRYLIKMHNVLCEDSFNSSKSNPTKHLNSQCQENFSNQQVIYDYLIKYLHKNGLTKSKFPKMTTGDDSAGLLEQLHGKRLEILYSQLSGTVHGHYWSFQQNTIEIGALKNPTNPDISTHTYSINSTLQGSAVNVAISLMVGATNKYLELFH